MGEISFVLKKNEQVRTVNMLRLFLNEKFVIEFLFYTRSALKRPLFLTGTE